MGIESILILLLVGAIAGWLAGILVKGYGFGLIGNIIVGIIGAFLAGLILPRVGFTLGGNAILASIIYATIGAVILLLIIRVVKRA
ncbi:GlsB/YeaQ/YmgE family stress response membrane protein [Pseudogemmobacter faecipullorum]|uniref:GlsB/YeaQ/YmgE family stress response membrane protein n=1 Tax=Pseudogemmobacter faecipullorum TaxID=2755041 RepID=A0ABS8CPB5_9RHOB|nr:GlsB/YeaQ/YmgE family stress response membrane protein [Pseudogemmobacter faecipullorum]MCB5411219.1 GlsB/YeaQ/YmgE family stress response membrane protein [Pseudogemmobacter faecipullorum]